MLDDKKTITDSATDDFHKDEDMANSFQNQEVEQEEHKIEDLEKEIIELTAEKESLRDKLLRAVAEGENIRRRGEKNVEEARDYSLVNITRDLIAVMDNLTRALEHKPNDLDEKSANIYAGIEMTKYELGTVFKKYNVEIINPLIGEKFDYNIHEAVAQIPTTDYNQDSIVSLMQPGYRIKDRLLRPAMVTVSKKT